MRLLRSLLCVLLLLSPAILVAAEEEDEEEGEIVELIPDSRAGWSPVNLFAPITGFFLGGPGYWYAERRIEIETVPPGALLDLFYVRANFQKAYEQAEAPVTVVLPSRVEAGGRDSVMIRAMLDGYEEVETHVRVRSRQTEVLLELPPLANSLVAMTHTALAGRASLSFLTKEALAFRISRDSKGETWSVVLAETGMAEAARDDFDGISSELIDSIRPQQLGQDLVVRVGLTEKARSGEIDVRQRQNYDPVRGLHTFSIDLVPADGGAAGVNAAIAALARISSGNVSGCTLEFDQAVRTQLDTAELTRALAPKGSFTDPYLRAAIKRLGELSPGGVIRLADGSTYDVRFPIELSAASSQAAHAQGYLALLRSFVAELEPPPYRRETLRGLIAPEVSPDRFDTILDNAELREQRCRSGTA